MEDVGAGQGLQPAVFLAYGLPTQATVQLGLLYALVETHDVGPQLPLQPLAAVDALAQTVQLQLAQLGQQRGESGDRRVGREDETKSALVSSCPTSLLCPAQEGVPAGSLGHWAISLQGIQSWLLSCLADEPRKNILPSLGLSFPSCRMRGWVRSVVPIHRTS